MNDLEKERIRQFINDPVMSEAVRDFLLKNFLKKKTGADVNILAASTLAVYQLTDAWKELEALRDVQEKSTARKQIAI